LALNRAFDALAGVAATWAREGRETSDGVDGT
jgi:hypothetical protein